MSTEKIIEIKELVVQFDEKFIFKKLNLDIFRGETLAIVGGSGSGKSTLLRSILQLQPITHGKIHIFGEDCATLAPEKLRTLQRRWGMLFQSGALFSGLTTLENIAFPLQEYTKLKPAEIKKRAFEKLEATGLPRDAANKYPAELSGGMVKRAALARAIVLEPELLFLDEPSAGLDPESAATLDELIINLKKSLGLTIVMVTHDVDSLWTVTDRVAFLADGKVLEVAPIAELVKSSQAKIQHYFSGPRGRVAEALYGK